MTNTNISKETIKAHLETLYKQDEKLDQIYLAKKATLKNEIDSYENRLTAPTKKRVSK